jgi:hypothetical protein
MSVHKFETVDDLIQISNGLFSYGCVSNKWKNREVS